WAQTLGAGTKNRSTAASPDRVTGIQDIPPAALAWSEALPMSLPLSHRSPGWVALLALALGIGCAKSPAPKAEPQAAPVTVTKPVKKTMPIQARAIGAVKVISTVSVRPRVNGELTEVHFKEGDFIKAKDKLFTIDPLPYDAVVLLAKANLKKSEVALKGAE